MLSQRTEPAEVHWPARANSVIPSLKPTPPLRSVFKDLGSLAPGQGGAKKEPTPAYGVSRGMPGPYALWKRSESARPSVHRAH